MRIPTKFKKIWRKIAFYLPHKSESGTFWCMPIWLAWIIGGVWAIRAGRSTYAYVRRDNIVKHVWKYYNSYWSNHYTLVEWILKP